MASIAFCSASAQGLLCFVSFCGGVSLAALAGAGVSGVFCAGCCAGFTCSCAGVGVSRSARLGFSRLTTGKVSRPTAYIKNYEGKKVALRKGPGTKYRTIGNYPTGTKVTLLQRGKTWSKVSVGGKTGWMKTIFIKQQK